MDKIKRKSVPWSTLKLTTTVVEKAKRLYSKRQSQPRRKERGEKEMSPYEYGWLLEATNRASGTLLSLAAMAAIESTMTSVIMVVVGVLSLEERERERERERESRPTWTERCRTRCASVSAVYYSCCACWPFPAASASSTAETIEQRQSVSSAAHTHGNGMTAAAAANWPWYCPVPFSSSFFSSFSSGAFYHCKWSPHKLDGGSSLNSFDSFVGNGSTLLPLWKGRMSPTDHPDATTARQTASQTYSGVMAAAAATNCHK